MNDVPLLFAETVARFFDQKSLFSMKDLSSGHFGTAGRLFWEKQLAIYLNVVYNSRAKTFDYCLSCRRYIGNGRYGSYTYDPADHRFVRLFALRLYSNRSSLQIPEITWATATPSDPTLLKLLRAPIARTCFELYTNCLEFLELMPDYCTFNCIYAYRTYNEYLDAIIQRSQECGRLENVNCTEFFKKRGREASIEWILTNKRLRYFSFNCVVNPDSIDLVLAIIGVD